MHDARLRSERRLIESTILSCQSTIDIRQSAISQLYPHKFGLLKEGRKLCRAKWYVQWASVAQWASNVQWGSDAQWASDVQWGSDLNRGGFGWP